MLLARTFIRVSIGLVILSAAGSLAADPNDTLGARYDLISETCVITGNEFTNDVRVRLTVLNHRGDKYTDIVLSESDFRRIENVSIKVSHAAGKLIGSYEKGDMEWQRGFASGVFADDIKQYHLRLNPPEYPFTIDYSFRLHSNSLMFLPLFIAQRGVPVAQAEFEVNAPSELLLHIRSYPDSISPEITEETGRRHFRWRFDDVRPLPEIRDAPPGYNEPIRVAFEAERFELEGIPLESCTWEEIGRWLNRLHEGRFLPPPVGGVAVPEDPMGVVRKEYNQVIAETRYVAMEIGLGGWQPRAAALTAQRGFGDCKDLSVLLTSRLRNSGIEAHTACLLTRNQGITDTTFPSVQFNHVITMALVGKDTIWMDPTCNRCPLGDLPTDDETAVALVATEEGGVLRVISASSSDDNTTLRTLNLHLQGDYTFTFDVTVEARGNYALALRNTLDGAPIDQQRALVSSWFPEAGQTLMVDSFTVSNLRAIDEPIRAVVFGHALRPDRVFRSILYHSPYRMHSVAGLFDVQFAGRGVPVDLRYPQTIQDIITIDWDDDLAVDSCSVLADTAAVYSFGEIELTCRTDSHAVRVELTRRFGSYEVSVEQFGELDQFRNLLREIFKGYVKLRLRG